ncbi:MAG: hypothetical protein IPJ88_14610 [Myxococcales bacterium]|nr:MAG: hypothetical protein IPJ88_14610 [Myxococcales bacterium]
MRKFQFILQCLSIVVSGSLVAALGAGCAVQSEDAQVEIAAEDQALLFGAFEDFNFGSLHIPSFKQIPSLVRQSLCSYAALDEDDEFNCIARELGQDTAYDDDENFLLGALGTISDGVSGGLSSLANIQTELFTAGGITSFLAFAFYTGKLDFLLQQAPQLQPIAAGMGYTVAVGGGTAGGAWFGSAAAGSGTLAGIGGATVGGVSLSALLPYLLVGVLVAGVTAVATSAERDILIKAIADYSLARHEAAAAGQNLSFAQSWPYLLKMLAAVQQMSSASTTFIQNPVAFTMPRAINLAFFVALPALMAGNIATNLDDLVGVEMTQYTQVFDLSEPELYQAMAVGSLLAEGVGLGLEQMQQAGKFVAFPIYQGIPRQVVDEHGNVIADWEDIKANGWIWKAPKNGKPDWDDPKSCVEEYQFKWGRIAEDNIRTKYQWPISKGTGGIVSRWQSLSTNVATKASAQGAGRGILAMQKFVDAINWIPGAANWLTNIPVLGRIFSGIGWVGQLIGSVDLAVWLAKLVRFTLNIAAVVWCNIRKVLEWIATGIGLAAAIIAALGLINPEWTTAQYHKLADSVNWDALRKGFFAS